MIGMAIIIANRYYRLEKFKYRLGDVKFLSWCNDNTGIPPSFTLNIYILLEMCSVSTNGSELAQHNTADRLSFFLQQLKQT